MTDVKRIFGRAKAQPRVFRPKKKPGKKDITEAEKQQERIRDAHEEKSGPANETAVKPPHFVKYKSLLFRGHPASKYLTEDGRYTASGKGRPPFIDPFSEGFDRLPPEVQVASLKRSLEDRDMENFVLKKIESLGADKTCTAVLLYQIFQQLRQAFPHVPKDRLFKASGLDPSREKELERRLAAKDKYEDIYPLVTEIYHSRNGRVGRISMAGELRKKGVYICDQTARKLMKKLNLTYRCERKAD